MKIDLSKSAIENCPNFDECQYNKCPLHKDFDKLDVMPEDRELYNYKECRTSKRIRMRIGKEFNLNSLGLFDKEKAGMRKSIQMKADIKTNEEKKDNTS